MLGKEQYMTNLISKLITNSQHSAETLKKRIKLTEICSEFEGKAVNQLMKFVEESSQRYKGMKLGNNIDSILLKSTNNSKVLYDKVYQDEFYSSVNVTKQKDYLRTKHLHNVTKNNAIKNNIELCIETDTIRNKNHSIDQQLKILNYMKNKIALRKQRPLIKNFQIAAVSQINFSRNKRVIDNMISHDQLLIEKKLLKYKNELKKITNVAQRIESKNEVKAINAQLKEISNSLSLGNLQFLCFTKKKNNKPLIKPPRQKKDIDLNHIIKYTKQYKMKHNASSIIYPNRNTNDIDNDKEHCYNPFSALGYDNTISLVKNEAKNSLSLEKKIIIKRSLLEKNIKSNELPKIEKSRSRYKQTNSYVNDLDNTINKKPNKNNKSSADIFNHNQTDMLFPLFITKS